MSFLYPNFLYALSLIAIPIIIHLFQFRRFKKVYFSNVKNLDKLQTEKQNQRRLKHLLILLSRILAISALVIAFAQPYFPEEKELNQSSRNYVSIYLDNSYSSSLQSSGKPVIEIAKTKALEIIESYRETDKFQLITNDFKIEDQRFLDKQQIRDRLSRIDLSPDQKSCEEILDRVELTDANNDADEKIFIISDFQENFLKSTTGFDTSLTLNLIKLNPSNSNNLFIDSVWLENPISQVGEQNTIVSSISNFGDKEILDKNLTFSLNNQQKGLNTIELEPGAENNFLIPFKLTRPGYNHGQLTLNDYPITFDDAYYLSFKVEKSANILLISDTILKSIETVYSTDSFYNLTFQKPGNIDLSQLNQSDLTIINLPQKFSTGLQSALEGLLENGSNLLLFLNEKSDIESLNAFLSKYQGPQVSNMAVQNTFPAQLEPNHPLLANIFQRIPENLNLPKFKQFYPLRNLINSNFNSIIELNKQSVFCEIPASNGSIFLSQFGLSKAFTNFERHALFVPIMYRTALFKSTRIKIAYEIGKPQKINIKVGNLNQDNALHLIKDSFDLIPRQLRKGNFIELRIEDEIPEAGIYSLQTADGKVYQKLAFNFNRNESKLEFINEAELENLAANQKNINFYVGNTTNISQAISKQAAAGELWKIFIALGLIFLFIEILLIKLWPK